MIWLEVVKNLPAILALLAEIKKRLDEDKLDRKVHEDLNAIKDAFKNRDVNALNDIFNKLPDKTDSSNP